ncbi:MAG TPA: chromosomal replication initiator protein DnaA [bacterium]|jgi:chromosomal replication initiator protein
MIGPPQPSWDQFLQAVQGKIPQDSFLTWFSPLKLLAVNEGVMQVGVPNQFFYEFLETHYREQILAALAETSDGSLRIQYQITERDENPSVREEPVGRADFAARDSEALRRAQLNPRYTFENFIEGDSNSFAKAAALAVAEAPGKTPFNPLFLYSPSGLGKTHLIQAVGNFSVSNNRHLKTVYVTSEEFVNDFISSIKNYKTTNFSRFYRTVDLLLLDDIHFFAAKERTQLEFFHTFNTLYQAGKQIVLTSDRPLKELDDFDTRLISRLGCGLIADIHPPDYETRLAILQKRSESQGILLPEDVAQFLASVITDNIRLLEGALIRLMAHCSITGVDISLALAKSILQEHLPQAPKDLSIEKIQQLVASHYKISPDLLIARTRKRDIAWARQVAMYLSIELTNASLQSIGTHFGNRDHSTVIHARDTVSLSMSNNPKIASDINMLKSSIALS